MERKDNYAKVVPHASDNQIVDSNNGADPRRKVTSSVIERNEQEIEAGPRNGKL